jgi:hypothetical protein
MRAKVQRLMRYRRYTPILLLLLALWATRVLALEQFPLHNDEGLHLTRAVEVWNLHPFWEIDDGKIINHWAIAVFYPQHTPVFAGRIATVFIALIGLAAAYALVRQLAGTTAASLTGLFWIMTPCLFLYERFAFSDAEAGVFVVLTLLFSLRLTRSGKPRDAVFAGIALTLAALFKLTAAPYALMVLFVVLGCGKLTWRRRLGSLIIIGLVGLTLIAVPLLYVVTRGGGFGIALGWIGGAPSGHAATTGENLARLWAELTGFGSLAWPILLVAGLIAFALLAPAGILVLIAALLPLASIVFLGIDVMPRHFVVALPIALTLAGAGLGLLIRRLTTRPSTQIALTGLIGAALLIGFAPFALTAYRDPGALTLPPLEQGQYVTEHSAGFGLREAVIALPQTVKTHNIPIIASMFPDSCRRANFYQEDSFALRCTTAPGANEITEALAAYGQVYVLVEKPPVGIDIQRIPAKAERLAAYPRPGETEQTASVVLWRLEKMPAHE